MVTNYGKTRRWFLKGIVQGGGFVIGGTVMERALTLLEQPGPVDLEGRATSEAPRASGFLIPTPLAVAVTLGHPEIS